jgi:hypothetical protein
MRIRGMAIWVIAALCLTIPTTMAEEKTTAISGTQLRMTVVFTELEGTKKLSNLLYEITCQASTHDRGSAVKIGYRVPWTGAAQVPVEYQDIGTMLDCFAVPQDTGGAFIVQLKAEHLTVYSSAQSSSAPVEWHPGAPLPEHPIFGQVMGEFHDLVIRDGQMVEAFSATDPVSGHTWKVNVTLNAVK